ncbi:MAG: pyrroline-5-carboxylate reductase [Candidatus Limnocylindria bacterium]
MPLRSKRLAFLGGGTMAEAVVRGLLERHLVPPSHVTVTGPRRERRAELAKRFGVRALASNAEAAKGAHVVVLSVKPQVLTGVMRELHGKLKREQLVLSIVAGATLRSLRLGLGHEAIVRSMPNTPAQVGMGVTVWTSTDEVTADQRELARLILGALGEVLHAEVEEDIDRATALSGTGPSYVFLLMEALVDAGVHLGFSRRVAEELVLRTVEGSAAFARASGRHLAELRNQVTSPGGTSAAAVYELEKGALRTVLSRAVYAAYRRTRELGATAEAGVPEERRGQGGAGGGPQPPA